MTGWTSCEGCPDWPRCQRLGRCTPTQMETLFEALRRNDSNLPHLLDVAVQILRDEDLFKVFEEVLYEDWEAARNDGD